MEYDMSIDKDSEGSLLVTGVGSANGLGAAIARRFAREGYAVVIAGRSKEKLEITLAEIQAIQPQSTMVVGDVTKSADMRHFVSCAEEVAPVRVAVHNAGSNNPSPFLDVPEESFTTHWREHTLGAFLLSQAVLPGFIARNQGTLLFTGASASLRGKAKFSPFAAAKGGLRNLAQSLSREFGPQNIHVGHIVIDGGIDGERLSKRAPQLKEQRGPDGMLNIDAIADSYWLLHTQHRSAWTLELDLRPWSENF